MEPFNVEHVKTVCRNILLPDKPKRGLLWGFRLNAPDLMSVHDYRWPFPGNWATAPGPFTKTDDPCPPEVGDGICIAKTLGGAQSGDRRIGSSSGLLLAYVQADVLAESSDKLRVKRAWVAEIFDPVQAVVLSGADLSRANLSRANLDRAALPRAYLSRANLSGANLFRANLDRANLDRAAYNQQTLWPTGFDPAKAGAVRV